MAYFHVYTKGLEENLLFRCQDDFVAGMNLLAVTVFGCDVVMMAFVLMSNHFHFVLDAEQEQAEEFVRLYKCYIARYLRFKYGDVKFLRRLKTSVVQIDDADEGLKRLIAYVLNNPVKAGINCVPQGYEWSSARCYFNDRDYRVDAVRLDDFSVRMLRNLLHSKKRLPNHWRMTSLGYVIPQSYVDSSAVERIYGRSRSFEFFLSRSMALRTNVNENVAFSDTVVQAAMKELLDKKYGVADVADLDDFLMRSLLRDLKGRFSASAKQLARVVRVPVKDVLKCFE